jgi:OHCU decarboxylase
MPPRTTLAALNAMPARAFVAALGDIFEHSPWVAERVAAGRPYSAVAVLHDVMAAAVRSATPAEQLALIRAHPDLAGKAARARRLTAASTGEQAGAGLDQLSDEDYARFDALNAAYKAKFDFPFIIAVRGLNARAILDAFARRLGNDESQEVGEALAQIVRIARLRLADRVDDV